MYHYLVCFPKEGKCLICESSDVDCGRCTPKSKWCYCKYCTSSGDWAMNFLTLGIYALTVGGLFDWSHCSCYMQ